MKNSRYLNYVIIILVIVVFALAITCVIKYNDNFTISTKKSKEIKKNMCYVLAAKWCGFCTKTFNETNKLNEDLRNKIEFIYEEDPRHEQIKNQYKVQVSGFPTIVIINGDNTHEVQVGYKNKNQLEEIAKKL